MTKTKTALLAACTALMLGAAFAPAMAAQAGGGGGAGGGAAGGASGADGAAVSPNYDLIDMNGCVTVRWLQTCGSRAAR